MSDGSKIQATITIPKPTKPIFPEQMERKFIENFNNSQPLAKQGCKVSHNEKLMIWKIYLLALRLP